MTMMTWHDVMMSPLSLEVSPSCSVFFLLSLLLFSSTYLFYLFSFCLGTQHRLFSEREELPHSKTIRQHEWRVMKTMRCPVIIIILGGRRFWERRKKDWSDPFLLQSHQRVPCYHLRRDDDDDDDAAIILPCFSYIYFTTNTSFIHAFAFLSPIRILHSQFLFSIPARLPKWCVCYAITPHSFHSIVL